MPRRSAGNSKIRKGRGLDREDAAAVKSVADRLRTFAAGPGRLPLEVIRLRGGVSSGRPSGSVGPDRHLVDLADVWLADCSSGAMGRVGGCAPWTLPWRARTAWFFSTEAHLAPHLMSLIPALVECAPAASLVLPGPRSRPLVVALTATGDALDEDRFDLNRDDEAHSVVRRRLDAAKPVRVVEAGGDGGRALAESTDGACSRGASGRLPRLREHTRNREVGV